MSGYQTASYYANGPRPSNPNLPSQITNITGKYGKFDTLEAKNVHFNTGTFTNLDVTNLDTTNLITSTLTSQSGTVTTLNSTNLTTTTIAAQTGTVTNLRVNNAINLTGAINNLGVNRFVDKYTINNGMGPYKVDAVPICFNDMFGMPKFSNNLSTSTGGVFATTGGANGLNYTITQFDTLSGWDMVVYLPSSRTTQISTPVFQESMTGQSDNLGSWGITLADWNGPISNPYTSRDQFYATLGSVELGDLFFNFYNTLANSSASTTGARTTALNAIYAHPDYATIKNQIKYPFKTFNQIKAGSNFQFELLKDLNGSTGTFAYTGSDNIVYNTQITSTTYSPTGNLLPVSSNVNSVGGKMGLMIFQMGDGNNIAFDTFSHQAASWGYVVAYVPGTPLSQRTNKYGSTSNIASLIANKTIETYATSFTSTNKNTATYAVTGVYLNPFSYYNESNDNTTFAVGTASATGTLGFWRTAARQMLGTNPAQSWMERYFYQIKCVLNQIGVGSLIDYNNVVVTGISGGGYGAVAASKFANSGVATQYTVSGVPAPLFKTKAMVQLQSIFFDFSQQVDAGNIINSYNNRYALSANLFPLPCPLIGITTDGDYGNKGGSTSPNADNRFNHQLQTIYQSTKQYIMASGGASNTGALIFNKSAVFYKPGVAHTDNVTTSLRRTDDGQLNAIYNESYYTEWLQGWSLSLNPQWPALDNIYESGLGNELAYTMMADVKINTVVELLAHRFLGPEFPVPMSALQSFGLRCDLEPTHCDIIPEMEYLRVGPIAQMTYDSGYNVKFINTPSTSQAFNLVATGSNGVFKGVQTTSTFAPPSYTISQLTGVTPTIPAIAGQIVTVSNSTGAAPGANYALAYADGTNWRYMFNNNTI